MSKKPKPSPEDTNKRNIGPPSLATKRFDSRDGLGEYIKHPEKNPEGRVVEYDDEFVVIRDKYPKARLVPQGFYARKYTDEVLSSVHLLLLPRDPDVYFQHPLRLLSADPDFLSKLKPRVERLKTLAAAELRRQYGFHSASDDTYQRALEELMSGPDPPPPEKRDELLPPGRNWKKDVVAGAHTHPSMNHLHIHVLSREMHSPWLKHKKHYISFNTSFLVELEDFPLEQGSDRFHPGDWPSWDMRCWRCGKNFGNKFAKLKEHLEEEFEQWKKE